MSAQNPNNTLIGPVVSHDFSPPSRARRRPQMLALLAVTGALLGSAAWHADGDMLGDMKQWRTQIARGLQVSLRAVADGRDHPASAPSTATAATAAVVVRDVRPR